RFEEKIYDHAAAQQIELAETVPGGRLKIAGPVQNRLDLFARQVFDPQETLPHPTSLIPGSLFGDSLDHQHLLHAVDFLKLHLDDFVGGGLHHAPDELSFDGQFAVAAVNQHQQS